jgi:hypothetical protein
MAIAYSRVESRPDLGYNVVDITLDGSYSAGGYILDNKSLGMLSNPTNLVLNYNHTTATSDFVPVYDPDTNALKIFKSGTAGATLNECAGGDITSAHKIRATAYGIPAM